MVGDRLTPTLAEVDAGLNLDQHLGARVLRAKGSPAVAIPVADPRDIRGAVTPEVWGLGSREQNREDQASSATEEHVECSIETEPKTTAIRIAHLRRTQRERRGGERAVRPPLGVV
jgi:hypothetical protein